MADPTGGELGILGVKYASLVAGFAGAVVSLTYLTQLTTFQRLLAIFSGALVAGYCTPVITWYFGMHEVTGNGAAFLIGLTSMNIIPGVMKASEVIKSDLLGFFDRKQK